MFMLRVYKLAGIDKGNHDHEEFFQDLNILKIRFRELVKETASKLPWYEVHAYIPTVWQMTDEGWERILTDYMGCCASEE